MSGCGLRNGEAAAVNLKNIVADDVYRITEQVNQTTKTYGRLKHRKVGEYRDVPLPARIKETIDCTAVASAVNGRRAPFRQCSRPASRRCPSVYGEARVPTELAV
jgi:hypothetical protein